MITEPLVNFWQDKTQTSLIKNNFQAVRAKQVELNWKELFELTD